MKCCLLRICVFTSHEQLWQRQRLTEWGGNSCCHISLVIYSTYLHIVQKQKHSDVQFSFLIQFNQWHERLCPRKMFLGEKNITEPKLHYPWQAVADGRINRAGASSLVVASEIKYLQEQESKHKCSKCLSDFTAAGWGPISGHREDQDDWQHLHGRLWSVTWEAGETLGAGCFLYFTWTK